MRGAGDTGCLVSMAIRVFRPPFHLERERESAPRLLSFVCPFYSLIYRTFLGLIAIGLRFFRVELISSELYYKFRVHCSSIELFLRVSRHPLVSLPSWTFVSFYPPSRSSLLVRSLKMATMNEEEPKEEPKSVPVPEKIDDDGEEVDDKVIKVRAVLGIGYSRTGVPSRHFETSWCIETQRKRPVS